MATGSAAREIALASSTRVAAGLHRQRRVGGRADAGVQDHRHARALDDQPQVVGVVDAHPAADRRAERHHRRAAGVLQPARQDRVVVRVGEHHEAVADQRLRGLEQLGRVGQQRAVVADHLELDPVGAERLAREPRGGDRLAGGEAAGGVGEHLEPRARRAPRGSSRARSGPRGASRPSPARRPTRAPPPPSSRGCGSRRCRGSAASCSGRPAISNASGDPPCTACSTSTSCPSRSAVSAHSPRGITSPLTATAVPRRSTPSSCTTVSTVASSPSSRYSPLTNTFLTRAPPRTGRRVRAAPARRAATRPPAGPPRPRPSAASAGRRCASGPVAHTSPSSSPGPTTAALSGVPGRSPAPASTSSSSPTSGTTSQAASSSR